MAIYYKDGFCIQMLGMILTSKVTLMRLTTTCSEDSNYWSVDNPANDNCCLQHTREVPGGVSAMFTKRSPSVFQPCTGIPDDKGDAKGESAKEEGKDLGQQCLRCTWIGVSFLKVE